MRRALVAAAASAVLVPTLAATTAAADSPVQSGEPKPQRLLVISLPMLAWKDANDHRLPNLNRLLDESAVADLTTRTISRETKLADGYITLGAGTRSIGAGTDVDGEGFEVGEPFGADNAGQVFERRTGRTSRSGLVDLGIGRIQDRNKQELFDAEIGALGDALAGAGWSRAVIANGDGLDVEDVTGGYYRRQAVAGLMGSDGKVPTGVVGPELLVQDAKAPFGLRYDNDAVVRAFRGVWKPHSVVLVEASDLFREDMYRQFATPDQRNRLFEQALRDTDQLVGALLRDVDPQRDAVMVVGPAHPLREVRLTIAALRAPGLQPGLLRSGTTRRSGFVQLIDVAPTILDRLGIDVPDSMEGRPFELGDTGGSAADRRSLLADADTAAQFRDDRVDIVAVLFIVVQALLGAGVVVWLARPGRLRLPAILHFAALAALGFVPAVLLARLVPFHKAGDLVYWSALAVASLALAGLYRAAGRWRRDQLLPLMLALGLIVAVLVLDVLLGAPLQFNNPFGYSPKVAGRFSGYGNLGYAALASAAVLLSALVAHRLGGQRGALIAIGLLGVVFVVDGTPFWGSDVGGVLSMLPAFAVTAYLLLGLRIRFRTLVLSAVAAVAALIVFGLIDLSRPRDQRTHLGRLFETTGSRGWSSLETVIERKISENLSVLFRSVWLLMVLLVLAFLVYLYMQRRERLRAIVERIPELRAGFIGFAIVATLGFALNDSGIAVPGMMLGVLNATMVALLLVTAERGAAPTSRAPAAAESAEPAAIPA